MGTPAASDVTLAPGAGHGGEGDASLQGPAQEEVLHALPKSTQEDTPAQDTRAQVDIDAANAALSSVIELKARRNTKSQAAETTAALREAANLNGSSLVTVRAKPEKRKNAKERSKERFKDRKKDNQETAEVAAVIPEVSGLSTAHPKPEKRKNAKERAKEKYAKKSTEDGTTPAMTAKAKSKVATKVATKAETKKVKKSRAAKAA